MAPILEARLWYAVLAAAAEVTRQGPWTDKPASVSLELPAESGSEPEASELGHAAAVAGSLLSPEAAELESLEPAGPPGSIDELAETTREILEE